jgi:hypothetical protein
MTHLLNLPVYLFKTKSDGQITKIFDSIRRKYVTLTPEEWVRQNFIQYLIAEKKYPASLLAIEMPIKFNSLKKRGDIVVFHNSGSQLLMVECKAPEVKINQQVFDQIARYNLSLKVKYLVVTNGLEHYCCLMDHANKSYLFLEQIPDYSELVF